MVYIILILFGLALGSFVNALAWRVHKQSVTKNTKKSSKYSIMHGRSMCPKCEHSLSGADLIPVLSWSLLKGRCRYCKKSISAQYPAVELLFVLATLFSYHYWPYVMSTTGDYVLFCIWLLILVVGFCMSIIDIKWQLLPTRLVYVFAGLSAVFVGLSALINHDFGLVFSSLIGSALLFGVFWSIYQISSGKWIGGGDVRLLAAIGLLLGWQNGLLAVVLASYLATIIIVVLIFIKKYKKGMRIAFGPFLLTGSYFALIFGDVLVSVYKSISGL